MLACLLARECGASPHKLQTCSHLFAHLCRCLHEEVAEWPFLEANFPGDKDNLPSKADRPAASSAASGAPAATAPSEYANILKDGGWVCLCVDASNLRGFGSV